MATRRPKQVRLPIGRVFGRNAGSEVDHAAVGAQAQAEGDEFEDWINDHAKRYLPGLDLVHIPARWKTWPVGKRYPELNRSLSRIYGRLMRLRQLFFARPLKVTWVDFIALLPDGGCAHFDAKFTAATDGQWRFASKQRPVLKEHQLDMLARRAERGEPCFIYLRNGINHILYTDYVLPYLPGEGLPLGGNKNSIAFSKLEKWRIPKGKRHWCWLDACCSQERWALYCREGWAGLAGVEETYLEAFMKKKGTVLEFL